MSNMEEVIEKAIAEHERLQAERPDEIPLQVRENLKATLHINLTASGYGGFKVVPLVWRPVGGGWYAETEFGEYRVYANAYCKRAVLVKALGRVAVEHPLGIYDTLEAAKAACEADHRERVSKLVRGVDVRELVVAARRVLDVYDGMEDGNGEPCPDLIRLRAALPTEPEVK